MMKKNITIAFILAALVAVTLWFSAGTENAGLKQALRDTDISQSTEHGAESQDYSASNSHQKTQNKAIQSYGNQQLEPEIEAAVNELVSTSHEGLVEVKTDKGVGVDLKGRFRSAPVATFDDDGQIVVRDYTSAPGR